MKTKLIILVLFIFIGKVQAQEKSFKHFDVGLSVIFWTPTSLHINSSNSVTQYAYPDGSYISTGGISGYGTSLAPVLDVKYYFNKNVGVSLGFYFVHLDNDLYIKETDSTFSSFENMADIPNFTLGITGKLLASNSVRLFYETGLDLIPNYGLEMKYSDETNYPPDMDADGAALGVYCEIGTSFRIIKSLYFNSTFMYSFIPVEVEYTNSNSTAKTNVKTNLGGIGLYTGMSFNF